MSEFLLLDAMPLTATVLAAVVCSLIGNFLVLRREAMLGDAISHAVLPGLIAAFILLESKGPLVMLLGAAGSGLLCVGLIGLVKRWARLESGASIGVVFTVLFAAGVLMVELFARNSHIDVECVLFGDVQLLAPWDSASGLPRQVWMLIVALGVAALLIGALFKELRLVCFDPVFGNSIGFGSGLLNLLLMVSVAFAVVASFEAVGSILVLAMLVCPAACARLLTDRLATQLAVSVSIALGCALFSYLLAARGLAWISGDPALSVPVSGTLAVASGLAVGASALFAPRHGLLASTRSNTRLRHRIMEEDVLGVLYRLEEGLGAGGGLTQPSLSDAELRRALCRDRADKRVLKRSLHRLAQAGQVVRSAEGPGYALTESGRSRASGLIRTHRLWESYLVQILGLRPDHVHRTAEDLEHLTDSDLAAALENRIRSAGGSTSVDPHHRPIPGGEGS